MTGLTSGDHVIQIKLIMGNGYFKTMQNIVGYALYSFPLIILSVLSPRHPSFSVIS